MMRFTFLVILETVLTAEGLGCVGGFSGGVTAGGSSMLAMGVGSGACVVGTGACVVGTTAPEAEVETVAFWFDKKSAMGE